MLKFTSDFRIFSPTWRPKWKQRKNSFSLLGESNANYFRARNSSPFPRPSGSFRFFPSITMRNEFLRSQRTLISRSNKVSQRTAYHMLHPLPSHRLSFFLSISPAVRLELAYFTGIAFCFSRVLSWRVSPIRVVPRLPALSLYFCSIIFSRLFSLLIKYRHFCQRRRGPFLPDVLEVHSGALFYAFIPR